MTFASTRSKAVNADFREAVFKGLAPDGGLFHPTSEPDLRRTILEFDESTSFTDIAGALTARLFPGDFSSAAAARIAKEAFPFSPELRRLDGNISILELFHGPSCAFKDFGASFLAAVMEEFLENSDGMPSFLRRPQAIPEARLRERFTERKTSTWSSFIRSDGSVLCRKSSLRRWETI